eukprot:6186494-Pleurochrysis_carterae.AAC.3
MPAVARPRHGRFGRRGRGRAPAAKVSAMAHAQRCSQVCRSAKTRGEGEEGARAGRGGVHRAQRRGP